LRAPIIGYAALGVLIEAPLSKGAPRLLCGGGLFLSGCLDIPPRLRLWSGHGAPLDAFRRLGPVVHTTPRERSYTVSVVLSLAAVAAQGVRTVVRWGVEHSTDAEALAQIAGFDVEQLHWEATSGSARGSASPSSTASSAGQAHP
jgi:hypothetical protein